MVIARLQSFFSIPRNVLSVAFLALLPRPAAALPPAGYLPAVDWHVDPQPFVARITEAADGSVVLENGLVRRVIRTREGCGTLGLDDLMTGRSLVRAVRPEGSLTIDGKEHAIGGLVGQPNQAFLTPEWLAGLKADPAALQLTGFERVPVRERMAWKRVRHASPGAVWPPKGVGLRLDFAAPPAGKASPAFRVSVHYELYDGLPLVAKWLVVTNDSDKPVTLDAFRAELLAVVEHSNPVDSRPGVPLPVPDSLHVETDQAFAAFTAEQANAHAVRWEADPRYGTQVNYLKQMPCLLTVGPSRGPAQVIEPGESFESFRVFVLVQDSSDRERQGLARRRMARLLAPWVTENPLMHHLLASKPELVRAAIDQAAEVGFEMVILSFGSGFNAENKDPAYLEQWRDLAAHAASQGIDLGGYSLLASRSVGGGNDVVSPPGESPTFGKSPALTSPWGLAYFETLRKLYETTGFTVLEHDGSYPGDWDVTPRPPLQRGLDDSQWAQWRIITDFYRWCRGRGVYLNVPDYYYLAGSNKCGMGYREVNWSLPRDQQVIHTRQNIFDGTWTRTPSMGWMFVPLAQYHGGGAAATIEPLDTHLDHYQRMLSSNLALGVQACYRGPRLFDTPRTKAAVAEAVAWYKAHREILESDVIHLRRADGLDWDGMLHVNPALEERALLAVFNPLPEPIEREILVPLHYAGLVDACTASIAGGPPARLALDPLRRARMSVTVPPRGHQWVVFKAP
jgi:hypothetical protein